MACQEQPLVEKIFTLYEKISRLESLKPCKDVNTLFTELVTACIPPTPIDVSKLCGRAQEMKSKLIRLCGEAEGHLESHYATILGTFDNPLDHLTIFPYFDNYIKLSQLENDLLTQNYSSSTSTYGSNFPKSIAFVGSGPLPLTSLCLAKFHFTTTSFHNYDIDPSANSMASNLIKADDDLSNRMFFHTTDIMDVSADELKSYDVVFLAALVGTNKKDKLKAVNHLANNMAPGAILMLRSAHGARAFLYPVIDPCELAGFEVLSVYHPTDEVVNSVVVARRVSTTEPTTTKLTPAPFCSVHKDHHQMGLPPPTVILPLCKCSDYHAFNALNHAKRFEEFAINDQEQY